VKRYVAVVEALKKKERGDETQFTTKIGGKTSLKEGMKLSLPAKLVEKLVWVSQSYFVL
jgi:hypothetical protein